MKHKILTEFKAYLRDTIPNTHTADTYYYAVQRLFQGLPFSELSEVSKAELEERMARTKGKSNFSAAKNGLKHLAEFDHGLQLPEEQFFRLESKKKKAHSVLRRKTIYADTVHRKVNGLHNEKLKLAYRLMEVSGLRVSEAAALTKQDITINGNTITVNVLHGKGGSNGHVVCREDKYLTSRLAHYLDGKDDGERLFYSAKTMKNHALNLGLECHNFRRMAAIEYRQEKMKDPSVSANGETQKFLRHERFSTTKRYLFNRKLQLKQKKEE